jgi:hypothetical protein
MKVPESSFWPPAPSWLPCAGTWDPSISTDDDPIYMQIYIYMYKHI